MQNTAAPHEQSTPLGSSPIVELRQYALHKRQRDVLIELFERELIETQEEVGMRVIGQFVDADDPDKFVWLRGFADMKTRRRGLEAFYGGPAWRAHAAAANATMIDSDNVFLLRPARPGATFRPSASRPPVGAEAPDGGGVSAGIVHLTSPDLDTVTAAVEVFESAIAPEIAAAGGSVLGYFVSETSRNDFPRLPVREGEPVLVWFAGFGRELDSVAVVRAASAFTNAGVSRSLENLRLVPTARSLVTGETSPCAAAEDLGESLAAHTGETIPRPAS